MSEQTHAEWLAGLKVGDEVVVENRYGSQLETVERTTATQIILPRDVRYDRRDGRKRGRSSYDFTTLQEPTSERRAAIRQKRLTTQMDMQRWGSLTLSQLQRIAAIVAEGESK